MPPEARVRAFLAAARRRLVIAAALRSIAAAAGIAAIWIVIRGIAGAQIRELAGTALVALAAAAGIAAWRARRTQAAAAVEARSGVFNNTLITSDQILRDRLTARPAIRDLVLRDTAARTERVDLPRLLPLRRPVTVAAVAGVALLASVGAGAARPRVIGALGLASEGARTDRGISFTVTVAPPAYTSLEARRLENPAYVEAIEGSRLTLTADGRQLIDTVAATQTALDAEGVLVPLSVLPDHPPAVTITEPGRDLFLADPARDIRVRVTATDDFGVTALALAYTKVSGSGETFSFVEGTLPLTLSRTSARELAGTATLRLGPFGLAAGDTLVYRAIARDAHPTRPPAESDALIVEIVGASEAVADGFAIDDQRDRYALSQQMVILKTERLIAARRGMSVDAVAEASALIAAEQRQVRTEFVFMMGGEVEDEEVEAEHSHELAEGREQNEGRRDLIAAIRSMSDAAALLMEPNLDQALAAEKRALVSLQRALTRSRYILRVLSTRERIDDARRLTGDRTGAAAWRLDEREAKAPAHVAVLGDVLAALTPLARRERYDGTARAQMTALAGRLLAAPAGPHARDAAEALAAAGRERDAAAIARHLDRAALALDAALESAAPASAAGRASVPSRVRSALAASGAGGAR